MYNKTIIYMFYPEIRVQMIDIELKYLKILLSRLLVEIKMQNICGNVLPMLHFGAFG